MTAVNIGLAKINAQARAELAEILRKDHGHDGQSLDDEYNQEGDGEHPVFIRTEWRQAVENLDTVSGYWDWCAYKIDDWLSDYEESQESLQISIREIGSLDQDTGKDRYILLTRADDVLSPSQAEGWLLPQVWLECRGPGTQFTTSLTAIPTFSANQVICVVHHRRDV